MNISLNVFNYPQRYRDSLCNVLGIFRSTGCLHFYVDSHAISTIWNRLLGNHKVYNVFNYCKCFFDDTFLVTPEMKGGFVNRLVPTKIGSAGMAFPRLNNISF